MSVSSNDRRFTSNCRPETAKILKTPTDIAKNSRNIRPLNS